MSDAEKADQQIGAAVKAVRADMSQHDLAERMRLAGWKWTQATVWSVESGKRPIRLAEAKTLAEILGTDLARLLKVEARHLARTVQMERATDRVDRLFRELQGARSSFESARSELERHLQWARGVVEHADSPDADLLAAVSKATATLEHQTADRANLRGVNEYREFEHAADYASDHAEDQAVEWDMRLDGDPDA